MSSGLPVAVHLAVNLLACFAAAGLAVAVLYPRTRGWAPGPRPLSESLLVLGAGAIAVAHALEGALVPDRAEVVGWLLTGGLVSLAAGLSPSRVRALRSGRRARAPLATTDTSVTVPVLAVPVLVPAAWVGLAAGLLAAGRTLAGGRHARVLGSGLLLWGAAPVLTGAHPNLGTAATVGGALAVGGWVWTASADRLQAKFVTAFVAALLLAVVVVAAVLSTLAARALERDELDALSSVTAEIAGEIGGSWPRQAVDRLGVLSHSADELAVLVEQADDRRLRELLRSVVGHDVLAVLDPDGRPLLSVSEVESLGQEEFLHILRGSDTLARLLDGQPGAGELTRAGAHVVALGGIHVHDEPGGRAEDPPRFVVVTARVADDVWASQVSARRPFDVVLEAGGGIRAASDALAGGTPARVLADLGDAEEARLSLGGGVLLAASAPLTDTETLEPVGRVVTIRSGDVLGHVERQQARQLFLVILAGVVMATLIGAATSAWLVAPLRRLTAAATAVAEGRLDVRVHVGSRDEIGTLGRAFDAMTTSLSRQTARLRQAAEEQERLRARLHALHTSMGDALVAVDTAGDVVTCNPAAERLLGRDAGSVTGCPLDDVLVGRTTDGRPAAQALGPPDGERPAAVRLLLAGADERTIPTAATAAPVREHGGDVVGRVFVLRDITREVQVERMKQQFLANVSHELRTPLTPIKGYADILARREVDGDARRRYAGQILESTARLERVVAMIVEFAAFDAGEVRPQIEPTDVAAVVEGVLEGWEAREQRTFRRDLPPELPPVLVDVAMLRRCLDELLDNAVKFSPSGEPVTVEARRLDGGGGREGVRLSVHDRGVGIEPERLQVLFSDFYQGDGSENRHFGGLGLGLALVQRMVTAIGGDAAVESEAGHGATFHLYLPAAAPLPGSATLPPAATAAPPSPPRTASRA